MSSRRAARAARAAFAAALAAAAACGDAPATPTDRAANADIAENAANATPPVASAPPAARAGDLDDALRALARGAVRVEVRGGRLRVAARGASRFELLQALSTRLDFELEDWSEDDPRIDVAMDDATLEEVLARALAPTPYRLDYASDGADGASRVRRLEVGGAAALGDAADAGGAAGGAAAGDGAQTAGAGDAGPRRYAPATADETAAALAARAERAARRAREALAASESDDEGARLDAVELALDADDPAMRERLHALALGDPSPRVRAAAASALAFGAASWELVRALDDADDRVVLAAIDALSWSDDPHVADALARKLDDPDPEIARAAADALAARPDAR